MDAIFSNYAPTFLYVDKYYFADTWVFQETQVPYSMLRYIVKGRAVFRLGDQAYDVSPGDVFYVPQEHMLYCQALEEIVFVSVRFFDSIQLPGEDMLTHLWSIPPLLHCADNPEMERWFEALYQSAISSHTYKILQVRGYLNLICAALAEAVQVNDGLDTSIREDRRRMEASFDVESIRHRAKKSQVHIDSRVRLIMDYITAHPAENMTREEMCRMADCSESTLRRLFKAHTKKTIYEFTRETKMLYAARRLAISTEPVSAIAYDLGYESPSYFGKSFREVFGTNPQQYRKMSQNT